MLTCHEADQRVDVFNKEMAYFGEPSEATDAAWAHLIPGGRGIISQRWPDGTRKYKVISAFHQMHCLYVLRTLYFTQRSGQTTNHEHFSHCVEYLRQSLICFADRTFETLDLSDPDSAAWGEGHLCQDWNQLFNWAFKHREFDEGGIENDTVLGLPERVWQELKGREHRDE
ncbi:hypothetical protein CLCR_09090 [Cladophialophora carrionii]|uniref:Tat pathway signal sequence n=1 Tax=Cladophialophora carrionii TaxID=86049 RepID=A0A1C1CTF8_9EURO|nr:hypothetical protein CLCR_09090 [Cladophialophora carrionii]